MSRLPIADSVASKTASSRLDIVSSGPKMRKVPLLLVQLDDVAQKSARAHACPRSLDSAGRRHADRIIAKVRHAQIVQQQRRHWHADWRPCAARPSGASSAKFGIQPSALVEQFLRPVALAASSPSCCRCSGFLPGPDSGT